jgi:hypothetical protein
VLRGAHLFALSNGALAGLEPEPAAVVTVVAAALVRNVSNFSSV